MAIKWKQKQQHLMFCNFVLFSFYLKKKEVYI